MTEEAMSVTDIEVEARFVGAKWLAVQIGRSMAKR